MPALTDILVEYHMAQFVYSLNIMKILIKYDVNTKATLSFGSLYSEEYWYICVQSYIAGGVVGLSWGLFTLPYANLESWRWVEQQRDPSTGWSRPN